MTNHTTRIQRRGRRSGARAPRTVRLLLCLIAAVCSGQAQSSRRAPDLADLTLEQLGAIKITSASLHEERLEDAPASVTVITADDIRRFGYRTLTEALSSVRGMFATSDHTYDSIGIRGFALPGFETRYIIMINGHDIGENISDATFFGNDFPLDMDLVERIEVVRGASSALYGSNAMLATINVVTRKPSDMRGESVRVETGSLGERKIGAATAFALPRGANLLVSASVFNNAGAHELYFSGLDSPETNFGRAIDVDGERGYHAFADLTWRNWEVLAVAGTRVKIQPVSWGDTIFNDRGTQAEDSRGFLEVAYNRELPGDRTFNWRVSYDAYRYRGTYHYALPDGIEDSRERDYGDWVGSKFSYRLPDFARGYITAGAELRIDLRALQNVFDAGPNVENLLWINRRDRHIGVFAQQEWAWGERWEVKLGARFDWSWLKRNSISPRVAVIYKPEPNTDIKLLFGRGFRNPSSYDMFWTDDGLTQLGNPALRPETSNTYEIDFDRALTRRVRIAASAYHYRVNDLVEQIYTADGLTQFVNADRVRSTGASVELQCRLPASIDLVSSIEFQRSAFGSGVVLPNSPGQVGKLRFFVPLWRGRLGLGAGLQALGERTTYAGATVPWVILPEATLSSKPLAGGLSFSAGVKNLSNSYYLEPSGLMPAVDTMIGTGRTFFFTATWHRAAEPDSNSERTARNSRNPRP
jgi:outer membrane receptor protein involved in Fe transport